jgi:hypothetical protein
MRVDRSDGWITPSRRRLGDRADKQADKQFAEIPYISSNAARGSTEASEMSATGGASPARIRSG